MPPRDIRELRDLTRQRVHMVEDLARVKNRIGQLCETGNIKLSSVTTDLLGVSGRRMLRAIVEGKHDPGWMADYANKSTQQKEIGVGTRRAALLRASAGCSTKSCTIWNGWSGRSNDSSKRMERQVAGYVEPMRRVMTIPGIDEKTAWMIVAEVGVEMSVFGDAQHLASWAGLCPGNRESGGSG